MTLHQPLVADPLLDRRAAPATVPDNSRDNLLGVCHAIGMALGVNPLWVRIAFAAAMLANFGAAIAAYLAGALVLSLGRRWSTYGPRTRSTQV